MIRTKIWDCECGFNFKHWSLSFIPALIHVRENRPVLTRQHQVGYKSSFNHCICTEGKLSLWRFPRLTVQETLVNHPTQYIRRSRFSQRIYITFYELLRRKFSDNFEYACSWSKLNTVLDFVNAVSDVECAQIRVPTTESQTLHRTRERSQWKGIFLAWFRMEMNFCEDPVMDYLWCPARVRRCVTVQAREPKRHVQLVALLTSSYECCRCFPQGAENRAMESYQNT